MNFISAKTQDLPGTLHSQLASYRYKVFVERLGWELETEFDCEQDQFDHADTVHIVARNDDDQIVGCGRLLPCTGPYLLESVFPQLLNGAAAPRMASVWELSRFAAMDVDTVSNPTSRRDHMAERVLLEALRHCTKQRVTTLIAVSTLAMERLMQRAGVDVHRMGPPHLIAREWVLGFVINVNEQSISALEAFERTARDHASRSAAPAARRPTEDASFRQGAVASIGNISVRGTKNDSAHHCFSVATPF
jgi:acyl homoserine lactone synthase